MTVTNMEQMDRMLKEGTRYLRDMALKFRKAGVQVVFLQEGFSRKPISAEAVSIFQKARILVLGPLKRCEVELLHTTFHCLPLVSPEQLGDPSTMQSSHMFSIQGIQPLDPEETLVASADHRVATLLLTPDTRTVVLCGTSQVSVEEVERAFHDATCVVRCLLKQPSVVPGGGCCELFLAHQLRQTLHHPGEVPSSGSHHHSLCQLLSGTTQPRKSTLTPHVPLRELVECFAESLEHTVRCLCRNCQVSFASIREQVVEQFSGGVPVAPQRWRGLEGRSRQVVNSWEEGIVEPLAGKWAQIQLANTACQSILRISVILTIQ